MYNLGELFFQAEDAKRVGKMGVFLKDPSPMRLESWKMKKRYSITSSCLWQTYEEL